LSASKPAAPSSGFLARVGGWGSDIILLASFLAFTTAVIQIIIAIIVLIVGRVMASQGPLVMSAKEGGERLSSDLGILGMSVTAAVVLGAVFVGIRMLRRRLLARFVESGFETFVSKRYLLAREGGSLVSFISVVSVLGVSVGVMALVVVISVMNGFDRSLVAKMMGVFSHIEVASAYGGLDVTIPKRDYEKIIQFALDTPGVTGAAPLIQRQTLFQTDAGVGESKVGGLLRGVDLDREEQVSSLMQNVIPGGNPRPGKREIVLGSELARRLGVMVGERVYVLGRVVTTANGASPRITPLRVVGVFRCGLYDVDSGVAYANMETVQSLFVMEDAANAIHIKTNDPDNVDLIAYELAGKLPNAFSLRTWAQLNPEFFKALWIEKVAMFIILMLIVIVAAFNIIGTLVMTVIQKTREIGILKSMGATNGAILRIFLSHGFYIGTIGTALGVTWGIWICRFVERDIDKIFRLPPGVYGLDRLPVIVEPNVVGFIAGCAMGICLLASIIPSYRASRYNPVEALRHE
jgi:lipoprotein-releasing system permease protein